MDFGGHPGGVQVRVHSSADEFRQIAEPLYRRDPVANTIELTFLAGAHLPADTFLMSAWENGTAAGVALQTPSYPLACNGIPLHVMKPVVGRLAGLRPNLVGVRGHREPATAFADAWQANTGRDATIGTEERLYRLGTLSAPTNVAGEPREARESDHKLLAEWVEHFFADAFGNPHNDDGEQFVESS